MVLLEWYLFDVSIIGPKDLNDKSLGYFSGVFGYEVMGGFYELGCILAVAVMGAFIIYFNDMKP